MEVLIFAAFVLGYSIGVRSPNVPLRDLQRRQLATRCLASLSRKLRRIAKWPRIKGYKDAKVWVESKFDAVQRKKARERAELRKAREQVA